MVCHGELARLKPHPRYLTSFYVIVSLGGACGGIFVGLVAPNLFRAYYEFPIGLALTAVVLGIVFASAVVACALGWKWAGVVACRCWRRGFVYFNGLIMHQMVSGVSRGNAQFLRPAARRQEGDPRMDEDALRTADPRRPSITANSILREPHRREPVTYFCPASGDRAGHAGAGREAAADRHPGAGLRDAGGVRTARRHLADLRNQSAGAARSRIREFTYIQDTRARVEVALGDGRLLLEAEPSQHFDMLVMDAFSGDSVPVHLITKEAFATYFRHLKPDGILAVNISNAYLDLEPVMERAANAFGKLALVYNYTPGRRHVLLLLFLGTDHGPGRGRRASRTAAGREGAQAGTQVPDLDGRVFEYVRDFEVRSRI